MRFVALMLPVVLGCLSTCKSGEFNGESARAADPTPAPTPIPVPATPVPTPTPCVGDGITVGRLLTTEVKINSAGQYLDYELQLTDCNGNPKAITNQPLKFDFNGITNTITAPLAYELSVSDNSTPKINDTMEAVANSDLFGNTGSKYAHWQTKSISYAAASTTIKLRLDLSNRTILPADSTSTVLSAPVSIQTYLQLGNATPVQQNITVNP